MTKEQDQVLQMRVSSDWLNRIDDWRASSGVRPFPSRSQSIRQLVDIGIDGSGSKAFAAAPVPAYQANKSQNTKLFVPDDLMPAVEEIRARGMANCYDMDKVLRAIITSKLDDVRKFYTDIPRPVVDANGDEIKYDDEP